MTGTTQCSKCDEVKALCDFPRRSSAKDGRRGQCKDCYYQRRRRGGGIHGGGRLPIGPFRDWLNERLGYYGTPEMLAHAVKLDPRQVRRCLFESTRVSLDVVDRALIAEGSTPLWALAYTEEEFQIAAGECAKTERRRQLAA